MYRTAEFTSSFPNEWVFDANENPIAPGARELAEAFAIELRRRVESTMPIGQRDYYGWEFVARFDGCRFLNVLNPVDDTCYLTVQLLWQWLRALLLQRPHATFERYCQVVSDTLAAIPQVSAVQWQGYRH